MRHYRWVSWTFVAISIATVVCTYLHIFYSARYDHFLWFAVLGFRFSAVGCVYTYALFPKQAFVGQLAIAILLFTWQVSHMSVEIVYLTHFASALVLSVILSVPFATAVVLSVVCWRRTPPSA